MVVKFTILMPYSSSLVFFVCSTPAYDWAPNPDKQWILQVTDRMEPIHKKFTDLLMTKRLQTLQSIDEAIERVSKGGGGIMPQKCTFDAL